MTQFLLDASVLLAAEDTDDSQHSAARALLLSPHDLATLDLARYEVSNVAVRAWGDGDAAIRLLRRVGALEQAGALVRSDHALVVEAVGLAAEHGITTYDAAYAAAALRTGRALVSCDQRDLVGNGLAVTPETASTS